MAKNNGYVLALIAGILALISLLVPIVQYDSPLGEWYVWSWMLSYVRAEYGDDDVEFYDQDSDLVTWGLIVTLIILLAMIMLLATGAKSRGSNNNTGVWILAGIMLIVAPILYYFNYDDITNGWWWDIFDAYISFYLLIVAGLLALVAGFV